MAIKKKKVVRPSISDKSFEDLEAYIMGYESVNSTVSYSTEGITDQYLGQECVDILSDPNPDHGYFLGAAMESLGDARQFGTTVDNAINTRTTLIALCNAFGAASSAEGYSGLNAKSYWRSLEASGFADDTKSFGKRIWEGIKAAIKKLILMVINLVKSIGNFIKGAAAKAQEAFYRKYQRQINSEMRANKKEKMKIKSVSASKVWKNNPAEILRTACKDMTSSLSIMQGVITGEFKKTVEGTLVVVARDRAYVEKNGVGAGGQVSAIGVSHAKAHGTSSFDASITKALNAIGNTTLLGTTGKKIAAQAGKWFPSAAAVCNNAVYGKDKPSKNEVPINQIVQEGWDLLSPGALQAISFCFKTANTANKCLQSMLNTLDSIGRQATKYAESSDRKNTRTNINASVTEPANKIRRTLQFISTMLIHLYGMALSARMMVFSAAKKLVKKHENGSRVDDETKDIKAEQRRTKNATVDDIAVGD